MIDCNLIADLIRAGVDADLVGRVANAVAEAAMSTGKSGGIPVDTIAEKRRAYDRERKRAKRDVHRNSGGIPPDSAECPNSAIYVSTSTSLEDKKEKKERRRGKLCPPDFSPDNNDYTFGGDYGLSRPEVDGCCSEMKDWSHANANRAVALKADWHRTLRAWIRRGRKPVARAGPITDIPGRVFVAVDSPQWRAWSASRRWPERDFKIGENYCRGWYFESEWPPDAAGELKNVVG